jgi:hypothetical protein
VIQTRGVMKLKVSNIAILQSAVTAVETFRVAMATQGIIIDSVVVNLDTGGTVRLSWNADDSEWDVSIS